MTLKVIRLLQALRILWYAIFRSFAIFDRISTDSVHVWSCCSSWAACTGVHVALHAFKMQRDAGFNFLYLWKYVSCVIFISDVSWFLLISADVSIEIFALSIFSAVIFPIICVSWPFLLSMIFSSFFCYKNSQLYLRVVLDVNKSVLSLVPRPSAWCYPHLLLNVPAAPAQRALSSKPAHYHCSCRLMGQTDKCTDGRSTLT